MTQLEYTRLAQILGNQASVNEWMAANNELVNGMRSKTPLPELPPVEANQPSVNQPQITLPPRESALAARVEQSDAGQPEIQGSLSVNPPAPPPSNLSVKGPEDQSAYAKNTAILAALRSDPLGYISDVRGQQLGAFDERYKALTDPTSPQYRNRSQANWFNVAAQLMKPTMSGSVVENLGGAFGYLGSEAAKRQDLLAALQEKRAELAQKYDIAMLNAASDIQEKLIAARAPKYSLTSTGEWKIQPGTGGTPSMNNKGQYIVSTPEEAKNVPAGAPFIFASDAKPVPTVYYGQ